MTTELEGMLEGTSDPHVSTAPEPVAPATTSPSIPDPTPETVESPPNPVTGQPPAPDAGAQPEGAPAPAVEPQTAEPAAPPTLTQEQLQQIAQTAVAASQAAQQPATPAAQPELTPQQQEEMFRPVRVTPEVFQGLFGFAADNDQQIVNLQQFANDIAANALRMSMYYTTKEADKLNSQFSETVSPLVQRQRKADAVAQESRFMKAYPDLVEHKDLCLEIRDAAVARKMNFASETEASNFIATSARNILAKHVQAPAGTPPGQAPATPAPASAPSYSMPQTSMGGATGPSSGQGQANKSTVETLYS